MVASHKARHSASACARVTLGLNRPAISKSTDSGRKFVTSGNARQGIRTSGEVSTLHPLNSRGITPTIAKRCRCKSMVPPSTTRGSPRNREPEIHVRSSFGKHARERRRMIPQHFVPAIRKGAGGPEPHPPLNDPNQFFRMIHR